MATWKSPKEIARHDSSAVDTLCHLAVETDDRTKTLLLVGTSRIPGEAEVGRYLDQQKTFHHTGRSRHIPQHAAWSMNCIILLHRPRSRLPIIAPKHCPLPMKYYPANLRRRLLCQDSLSASPIFLVQSQDPLRYKR